jgi:hypothetical protein
VEDLADHVRNHSKAQIAVGNISRRTYLPAHEFPISISHFRRGFLCRFTQASKSIDLDILLERGNVHVRASLKEGVGNGGKRKRTSASVEKM